MRLNLGCGNMIMPGYTNCDLYNEKADVKCDVTKLPYPDNSVEEVYASHVIEHFDFNESWGVLAEWKRVLVPGGIMIIEAPDMLALCEEFVRADDNRRVALYPQFFGYPWIPGQTHKFLYTIGQLAFALDQLGMKNIVRERALRYIDLENLCLKVRCQKPVETGEKT